MNASDWVTATGNPYVGRGPYSRPANPNLVRAALDHGGKSWQRLMYELAAKTGRSGAPRHGAAWRRQQYEIALLTAPAGVPSARRTPRDTSIYAQSRPGPEGAAARLAHSAAVQRYRKRF